MKSPIIEFCLSRWVFLGLAMSRSSSRKEILMSHLTNWCHYTNSSVIVFLTFANLIVNRENLSIYLQCFLVLEIFVGFSICGIYMFAAPYKYEFYNLMSRIDEICDERKNEFTSEIYSKTEKFVYFLHKVILPLDSIFFFISYITMSVIFVIYYVYYLGQELDFEKLFHMMYTLYVQNVFLFNYFLM